jgi:hypothetical protein
MVVLAIETVGLASSEFAELWFPIVPNPFSSVAC